MQQVQEPEKQGKKKRGKKKAFPSAEDIVVRQLQAKVAILEDDKERYTKTMKDMERHINLRRGREFNIAENQPTANTVKIYINDKEVTVAEGTVLTVMRETVSDGIQTVDTDEEEEDNDVVDNDVEDNDVDDNDVEGNDDDDDPVSASPASVPAERL